MQDFDVPSGHHSGFVTVAGRPSVGKSTLINAYLGQTVAPVSPRPQTTRRRQLGILTLPHAQVIFVDTPGIHLPLHRLGEKMNAAAQEALRDADVLLVIVDLTEPPTAEDERVAEVVGGLNPLLPVLLALNKIDAASPDTLPSRAEEFRRLLPQAEPIAVSATHGAGRQALLDRLIALLPVGPRYYPEGEVTDLYERDIAAELIRAAAMHLLRDEVPYGIAVEVNEFQERGDEGAYLAATLNVEKESHKGIVIGKGGAMLKQIGSEARRQIEAMSGRRVYLDIRVRVLSGWRDNERLLRRFGFEA
ncbi:MAG: GTPase Era [Chloroflexota bacterium]